MRTLKLYCMVFALGVLGACSSGEGGNKNATDSTDDHLVDTANIDTAFRETPVDTAIGRGGNTGDPNVSVDSVRHEGSKK